jgi:hypothetical protein
MSSVWPFVAAAPSNVAESCLTPEPSSVAVHAIEEKSSVSKVIPAEARRL